MGRTRHPCWPPCIIANLDRKHKGSRRRARPAATSASGSRSSSTWPPDARPRPAPFRSAPALPAPRRRGPLTHAGQCQKIVRHPRWHSAPRQQRVTRVEERRGGSYLSPTDSVDGRRRCRATRPAVLPIRWRKSFGSSSRLVTTCSRSTRAVRPATSRCRGFGVDQARRVSHVTRLTVGRRRWFDVRPGRQVAGARHPSRPFGDRASRRVGRARFEAVGERQPTTQEPRELAWWSGESRLLAVSRGRRIAPDLRCCCAPGRTRTCDPLLRRQPLYPLSYRGGHGSVAGLLPTTGHNPG